MFRYVRTKVFLMALAAAGLVLYSQRNNEYPDYCTTKAYGWPLPWRIDNCECDGRGGLTEYPTESVVWNLSLALAGAFGVSRLVPTKSSPPSV